MVSSPSRFSRGLCLVAAIAVVLVSGSPVVAGRHIRPGPVGEVRLGLEAHGVLQGIEGAWRAETYVLADGVSHGVDGTIFFVGSSWQVLFFVLDDEGIARRGSAEGGSYVLEGDRLTFRHRYNLSAGEELEGLAASELRMQIREAAGEAVEPCTIELSAERLTIHFPSGNRMMFSRAPR